MKGDYISQVSDEYCNILQINNEYYYGSYSDKNATKNNIINKVLCNNSFCVLSSL